MPARDIYHDTVKNALVKDGWKITDDPLHLRWGKSDMYVDLGAEQVLAAEKGEQRIAVEIKSFLGHSEMKDLEQALGQFQLYRTVMVETKPEHTLYLAVPQYVVEDLFQEPLGLLLLQTGALRVIGFDPLEEILTAWKP